MAHGALPGAIGIGGKHLRIRRLYAVFGERPCSIIPATALRPRRASDRPVWEGVAVGVAVAAARPHAREAARTARGVSARRIARLRSCRRRVGSLGGRQARQVLQPGVDLCARQSARARHCLTAPRPSAGGSTAAQSRSVARGPGDLASPNFSLITAVVSMPKGPSPPLKCSS